MSAGASGHRRHAGYAIRLALVGAGAAAIVALGVSALGGPAQPRTPEERVQAVASTLRCPVCLNLSAADSPSPVAEEMRATIRRELEAGKSPTEIRAGFVAAYGEWILLAPPRRGLNWLAWLAPPVVVLGGLLTAGLALRRWTPRPASPGPSSPRPGTSGTPLSEEDRRLLEQALTTVREEQR